jgi:hypothetical protein
MFTGMVTERSLSLAAAMYAITIGLSSRNEFLLAVGIVASLLNAAFFGFISVQGSQPPSLTVTLAWVSIAAIALMHLFERANRHLYEREPFLRIRSTDIEPEAKSDGS